MINPSKRNVNIISFVISIIIFSILIISINESDKGNSMIDKITYNYTDYNENYVENCHTKKSPKNKTFNNI